MVSPMLLPLVLAAAAATPPPVVRAVVYPDRTELTRAVPVSCGRAAQAVRFAGLPPGLDPTSLRARLAGGKDGRVEGLSVREEILQDAHSAEVRALDLSIESLGDELRTLDEAIARASAARARAASLRDGAAPFLAREAAAAKKPDTAAWKAALDLSRARIEDADRKARDARTARREVERKLAVAQRRRDELAAAAPPRTLDVEVMARCAGDGARVELSYLVPGATWRPVYEARAADSRKEVRLTVLAELVQSTGETWTDVELALSTARSRRDSRPPERQPLRVAAYEEGPRTKVLVHGSQDVRHLEGGRSDGAPPADPDALEADDQGLSVQLAVPGRADVPGDGRPVRLAVETLALPATFRLMSVPRLVPHVLEEGKAANRARYPLLEGPVELFVGGSYVGTATLPRTPQGEAFELGFGVVEAVSLKRTVLEERKKDPGTFSSTRKLLYGYRIEVENHGDRPVELALVEQLPVAELDDVEVKIEAGTTPGYEHEKADGLLTWKVTLPPRTPRMVELKFTVKVPTSYDASRL